MFGRILWPALGAGCAAGLVLAVLQVFLTTPIILLAESFETAAYDMPAPSLMPAAYRLDQDAQLWLAHGTAHADEEEGGSFMPEDGLERTVYTTLTAVLTGVGFALLLVSAMTLKGGAVTPKLGLAWGACGFVTVALAPSLGLPPELPGSAAADIVSRQIWWGGTAVATAAGLWAIFFAEGRLWLAAGIALIAFPHILGAPHAAEFASRAPAELAGHFVSASLVSSAVFWAVLGSVAGALMQRQNQE